MRFLHGSGGDTLVEVVISLAILATMMATAYNVANRSYNVGLQSRENTEAASNIQNQAERLRQYRDSQVAADPNGTGDIFSVFNAASSTQRWYIGVDGGLHNNTGRTSIACFNLPDCSVVDYITETTNATDNRLDAISANIQVSWTSALDNAIHTLQINYYLTDTRPVTPCDNSISGSCQ